MQSKISWAICDDSESVIAVYRKGLGQFEDLEFVGSTGDAEGRVELCAREHPDVLLLDVQLDFQKSGIDAIPQIKQVSPGTKIVILSGYKDEEYIFLAFAKGAENYVLKEDSIKKLHESIVDVNNSEPVISGDIAKILVQKSRDYEIRQRSIMSMIEIMSRLSVSEFEVLKMIYAGKSYREIAKERFVELSTIKVQASRILKKFDESSMAILIEEIRSLKLFDLFRQ